ncbi:MAG: DUF3368 domain-containing protein [Acidobacteria bacterium]|nr:DUF3368 domain-containing protein [Acidobacteriota bacterium]
MIVVSDTSPILNLNAIGFARLFEPLYGQLLIPPAVAMELTRYGFDLAAAPWLQVRQTMDVAFVASLRMALDPGEAEAIALAKELKADAILIDERLGRRAARAEGIAVVGILGVLAAAKNRGLIPTCAPLVAALRQADFWLSDDLCNQFLASQGEA